MMPLQKILEKYRSTSKTEREKFSYFEGFIHACLPANGIPPLQP